MILMMLMWDGADEEWCWWEMKPMMLITGGRCWCGMILIITMRN